MEWQAPMSSTYKRFTSTSTSNSLEIKTKSIETILVPLVTQISTLVHFKDKSRLTSEKNLSTISRVGEGVLSAVERFVSVGERRRQPIFLHTFCSSLGVSIGHENPDIQNDLTDACHEARLAGRSTPVRATLLRHLPVGFLLQEKPSNRSPAMNKILRRNLRKGKIDRRWFKRLERYSVPWLAFSFSPIRSSLNKSSWWRKMWRTKTSAVRAEMHAFRFSLQVNGTLNRLESAPSFSDFMKFFAVYGTEMVDLAHLTGDRQNVCCWRREEQRKSPRFDRF